MPEPSNLQPTLHNRLAKGRASTGAPKKQKNRRLGNINITDSSPINEESKKRKRSERGRLSATTEHANKRSRSTEAGPLATSRERRGSGGSVDPASSPAPGPSPVQNPSSMASPAASPAISSSTAQLNREIMRAESPVEDVVLSSPSRTASLKQHQTSRISPSPEVGSPLKDSRVYLSDSASYDSVDPSLQEAIPDSSEPSSQVLSPPAAEPSATVSSENALDVAARTSLEIALVSTHEGPAQSMTSSSHDEQDAMFGQLPAPARHPTATAQESTGTEPYINNRGMDFGRLIPSNDLGTGAPTIPLYLPCDGRHSITLKVGSSMDADMNIQVNSTDASQTSGSSSNELISGAVVVFGTASEHKYRYVPPEPEVEDYWLKTNFTWSDELEPAFGGEPNDYSSIYFVRTKDTTNTPVVLKIISTLPTRSEKQADREREVLQMLDHENIIRLLASREDLIECTMSGTLLKLVREKRTSLLEQFRLSETLAPWVARQLLSALKFLQTHDIVHRDIKPDNVFLASRWSDGDEHPPGVVLGDFSLARLPRESRFQNFDEGTVDWIAPRSFRTRLVADNAIDLWGLGLIIWFIVAGLPRPWGLQGVPESDDTTSLDWSRLVTALEITRDCVHFLQGFLVNHPSVCQSIEVAETHPWMQGAKTLNWSQQGGKVYSARGYEIKQTLEEMGFDDED
ncbi:hypothetical protein FRB90_007407 [Tulasnella sp. 427]|nr:hypothetical protein FRB90_007407 [Tulasnella sp. 427]